MRRIRTVQNFQAAADICDAQPARTMHPRGIHLTKYSNLVLFLCQVDLIVAKPSYHSVCALVFKLCHFLGNIFFFPAHSMEHFSRVLQTLLVIHFNLSRWNRMTTKVYWHPLSTDIREEKPIYINKCTHTSGYCTCPNAIIWVNNS